ncbi:signal transduction histidine kinase [Actinoplanes digitatis]|uniref:histidine kinase n=2 Tax=Actinoplanes digitatis TaxID=1868 RepID=A0A7W7I0A1_9ACTN|nr:signal transduction histidine kinase [Actinoplanes digitatis]
MMKMAPAERLRAAARRLLQPSGTLPRQSWRGWAFDVILALSLALAAIAAGGGDVPDRRPEPVIIYDPAYPPPMPPIPGRELFLPIEEQQSGWGFVMLLVVLPLVFRRRYPLAVLWAVMIMAPMVADYHAALRLSFYACVIAAFTAAVHSPYRVPALASLPVAALLYSGLQEEAVPTVSADVVPFLILLPILVAADGLRRWKRHADEGRERLSALEREQGEALRRATEHERARIARELHDVVTHNVSVMVIQAGAARKVMDATPEQAREALLAVEAGGRAAMAELRHVMGLLTMDSDGPDPAGAAGLAPQPGLDRLDELVERVRDSGVPVELTMSGQARPVPSGVELAAYRVVQEALTNTVKHAAGATASVAVEYGADRLRVLVTDTGGAPRTPVAAGAGRGLIGLRERLAVYGGTLQAGRRPGGGYRVDAQIPLEAP